ncbi:MAG TPA: peroxidase family protein [Falsiroseomonas sp.]|jgi:hypothetical protein|nr:peroxidase family protein [Falsiroseomonas sp.]
MSYQNDPGFVVARALDGSGNNEGGQAFGDYRRITPNSYTDGKDAMTLPEAPTSASPIPGLDQYDGDLPQPRAISNEVMAQPDGEDIPNRFGISEYFQFFGQFLTHDIAEAPLGGFIPGVTKTPPDLEPDAIWLDGIPFPFIRTPAHLDADGVRQQENEETSFLDLSTVYGKIQHLPGGLEVPMLPLLRAGKDDGPQSAELLMGADGMLPTFIEVAADSGVPLDVAGSFNDVRDILAFNTAGWRPEQYAAGDNRVNQNAALLTHQTLWARNHNWHVDQLREKHPGWSEDQLFEAARAMNEAEYQHVVFNEYIAKLLGPDALDPYSGHKPSVNPAAINEWAAAGFRFGHDQSRNTVDRTAEDGANVATVTLAQSFALANAAQAFAGAAGASEVMNQWIRGQLEQATQEIDGRVVDGNRNALFGIPGPGGQPLTVDLLVLDIQRGRDHGTHRLDKIREGLGLDPYKNLDSFVGQNNAGNNVGREVREALKTLYDDVTELDTVVAGLLEKNVKGSMLGETFHALNVLQFEALRDGDRFFYLNRFKDNPELIAEIQATSLAEIIARNTGIHVYRDALLTHDRQGGDSGANALAGGDGRDLLIGFDGNDTLEGRKGNDDLYGDASADTLRGGAGEDLLDGGPGNDVLTGDQHADIFVMARGYGADRATDFKSGQDRLDLSDFGFDSIADVAVQQQGRNLVLDFGDGNSLTLESTRRIAEADIIFFG